MGERREALLEWAQVKAEDGQPRTTLIVTNVADEAATTTAGGPQ
jgi:hypothetical protein